MRKSVKIVGAMAFKVFLSYSTDPDEQVIVWRLQTLATASGIHVYVPQRHFPRVKPMPSDEVKSAIDESNCVLALITTNTSAEVENELSYALASHKLVIPIVENTVRLNPELLAKFPRGVFSFSRHQVPGRIENDVVMFLKQEKLSKENQNLVGALVAVGLGLLLLVALTKE